MLNSSEKTRRPMDVALSYLSSRMRTVREMEIYLDKKQYGEYEIAQVIDRLQELGYLNDEAYAREFIRTRINTKPVSKNKLRMQLIQHALPSSLVKTIIDEEIDEDMERSHAMQIAQKFAPQFEGLPPMEMRERLINRLLNRGFTMEDTLTILKDIAPFAYDDA